MAQARLAFDREHKGSLYARTGIDDCWIASLIGRVLEVYRDPGPAPSAASGWRSRAVTVLRSADVVVPAFSSSRLAAADLLP